MKVPAQWPTATSIYDSECVCMCMCVFALSNQSLNSSPPSLVPPLRRPSLPRPPHITSWQNDSPPLAHCNARRTVFGRPAEVAINPAARRTAGPLGYPTPMKPLSFFPLRTAAAPSSPTPGCPPPPSTLGTTQVFTSAVKQCEKQNKILFEIKKRGGGAMRCDFTWLDVVSI